ncbi:sigma-54 interaction domain-containing protein [Desulfobacter sp.]|uniref:sigma-54 interaction domain-containing protein n=1 Tax=Desulfobacter sp. TaxID=2294 RepID=UPI003D0FA588
MKSKEIKLSDEFFREVTVRITGNLSPNDALLSTLNYLKKFIPIDTMGFYCFNQEKTAFQIVAEVDTLGNTLNINDTVALSMDENFCQWLIHQEKNEEIVTLFKQPEGNALQLMGISKLLTDLAHHSVLILKLLIDGFFFGILMITAKGNDRFTKEHCLLIRSVERPLAIAMSNARRFIELERLKNLLREDNRALMREIGDQSGSQVIGADFGMKRVMEQVRQVAPQLSPVLLLGETGTGKEVIANAIHLYSPRGNGPMIRVQCGAIPETLLDNELFGHEKGAFTGAFDTRRGRFERASGGTIFLDEIAELSPEAQVKLLRVLQEKEFERVGGDRTIQADVRIIAATHRDLAQRVHDGQFRQDLFFRLNVFSIHLPPLRDRKQDIPLLMRYFIERKAGEMNLRPAPGVSLEEIQKLLDYDWPGNVRELQNIIERALITNRSETLRIPDLTPCDPDRKSFLKGESPSSTEVLTLRETIKAHLSRVLTLTGGRIDGPRGAARLLDMHPSTLRFHLKKLGLR